MLLYFILTKEQSNLLRLVLMIYIIHTRDIYTAYQNRSEHKEVKKKSRLRYAVKFDLSTIYLSLMGQTHACTGCSTVLALR